ncbi:hypothetical protein PHYSODRAFT_526318 [Phytophthora sojae]|uniref:Uncharacterized protein n=1 Tax=Phytophthora sojae (strain P6497) TaxID=1094619 RepID=G5A8C8_PHYSP|nr:hypothetical protein PHYSODRAFT_526318 [Phytophthora sojae]EGZ08154.1 hypothetical protein PHYSODRAFT_526318 [Phytophthora sojae]|eukprot:XP_009536326.1 hypothetical protein PHYSODRAFT_526318 [Phytophthora sojae]
MLSSIAAMQRTLQKLASTDTVVEAHSLASCFYNWYTLELWHTAATQEKQQFVRADLKAGVNIMIIAGREVDVPTAPLDRDGVAYRLWKQRVWTLAEDLDKKVNAALGSIDGKGLSKTAGSLRKRWRKLRVDHCSAYDALWSAFITRKANGGIVDRCTPASHQWKQKELES